MSIYLIIGFVFLAVFLFSFVLLYFLSRSKDPVHLRLKDLAGAPKGEEEEKNAIPSLKGVSKLLGLGSEQAAGIRTLLAQAGYRGRQGVFNYYGLRLFGALFLGILSISLSLYFHLQPEVVALLTIAGVFVGGCLPWFWVLHKVRQRREQIRRSVPSILDLIVVCVEAGLSLNAAMQKITEETKNSHKALSEELFLVNQEILIGKTRADAFRNLARRTGVDELRSLVVMLIQTEKLGTSIANSLRVLADSMRVKRRQQAEEAAHETQVKLVFPLVLLIFPELLVILAGPAVINLIKTLMEMAK
ncbi:MAG: type II secretion system F family protein [candidate division Zixibacteria bacterium]|nr:type II secretion system F family protein [candidate division Zixibacteria bacterium]